MEVFSDFRFWAFIVACLNFMGLILIGSFNYFSHQKIVGNDLTHLAIDLKEIKEIQENQGKKIDSFINKFTALSARCEERHSKK